MSSWTDEKREAYWERLPLAVAEHEAAEMRRRQRLSVKWEAGSRERFLQQEAGVSGGPLGADTAEREGGPAPERSAERSRGFSIPGARMRVKH